MSTPNDPHARYQSFLEWYTRAMAGQEQPGGTIYYVNPKQLDWLTTSPKRVHTLATPEGANLVAVIVEGDEWRCAICAEDGSTRRLGQ